MRLFSYICIKDAPFLIYIRKGAPGLVRRSFLAGDLTICFFNRRPWDRTAQFVYKRYKKIKKIVFLTGAPGIGRRSLPAGDLASSSVKVRRVMWWLYNGMCSLENLQCVL